MKGRLALNTRKWIRHGNYKIEFVEYRSYIRPVSDSGHVFYDFNELQQKKGKRKPNTLVVSLLNLDTSDDADILDFVNRFGLLGLLKYKYLEPYKVEIEERTHYFVPERNSTYMIDSRSVADNYLVDPYDYEREGFYKVRETMSEPIIEFIEAVKEFQYYVKFMYSYELATEGHKGPLEDNSVEDRYNNDRGKTKAIRDAEKRAKASAITHLIKGNSGLIREVSNIGNGQWDFQWTFESLLHAAYFFFTEDLSKNMVMGECPRCSNLFLSSVKAKKFCSRKCEDAARKAKSRKKKKEGSNNGRNN